MKAELNKINTIIRPAEFMDLNAILRLYAELRPHDPIFLRTAAEEAWMSILSSSDVLIIVAEVNSEVVSTAMIVFFSTLAQQGRPFGVVEHVITTQKYRRCGIGKEVMNFLLKAARERNSYKVTLLSEVKNNNAHQFYESLGFKGDLERGYKIHMPSVG